MVLATAKTNKQSTDEGIASAQAVDDRTIGDHRLPPGAPAVVEEDVGGAPGGQSEAGAAGCRRLEEVERSRVIEVAGGEPGDVHERHVPDGVAQADVLGTITKKHTRTIAKIAFNYLAFTNLGLAYLPELHDVRQFVLHGTPDWSPLRQVVPCPPNSEWRLKCHAVSVQCRGQTIVSTVITLGILKYTLVLNSLLLLIPGDFGSLHVFDIPTGKVKHRKI